MLASNISLLVANKSNDELTWIRGNNWLQEEYKTFIKNEDKSAVHCVHCNPIYSSRHTITKAGFAYTLNAS